MDSLDNQSKPSPEREALTGLATAFAADKGTDAAWKVVRPKGKKGMRNKRKGPMTSTSGSGTPNLEVAHAPENNQTRRQRQRLNRQQNRKEKLGTGAGNTQPTAGGSQASKPGTSDFYRERRFNQNKPVAKPNAPPATSAVPTVETAGSVGRKGKASGSNKTRRPNRGKRAEIAIAKSSQAPARNEPSKRSRLDDTVSPRGEHKKVRLDTSHRAQKSYAEVVQNELSVAVVRADGVQLNDEQITWLKRILQIKLMEAVRDPSDSFVPSFRGKPIVADGVLKLWCLNEPSLRWITLTVDNLPTTDCPKFMVKRQCELTRRVRAALFLPECENTLEDTNLLLHKQNRWALINSWTVFTHTLQGDGAMFLTLGIPEDVVPILLKNDRRLSHGFGSVYIRFYGKDGSLSDVPPHVATAAEAESAKGVSPIAPAHSSPMPSTSGAAADMCVDQEIDKRTSEEEVESEEEVLALDSESEPEQSAEGKPNDGDPCRL